MNNNINQVDLVPFSRLGNSSHGSGCQEELTARRRRYIIKLGREA